MLPARWECQPKGRRAVWELLTGTAVKGITEWIDVVVAVAEWDGEEKEANAGWQRFDLAACGRQGAPDQQ